MKRLGLICGMVFFTLISCDNEKDIRASQVPSLVLNSLETKFPNARDVEWETKNDNYFVDFEVDGADYNARINSKGKLLKFKYDLETNEMPETVRSAIEAKYPNKIIDGVQVIKKEGNLYYQIEFEGRFTDSHKIFDEKGGVTTEIKVWD